MANEPFFIFGTGRSGTSLLSRLLNAHPRLAVPFEAFLFQHFEPMQRYYGDLGVPANRARLIDDIVSSDAIRRFEPPIDRNRVLERVARPDFGGVVDAVLGSWAAAQGKARWGEKTPHHVFRWRSIRSHFPSAKFIHIVRDPRDVVLSKIRARHGPKTAYAATQDWTRYLRAAEAAGAVVGADGMITLWYEQLVRDPVGELKRVCGFLGEEYVDDMLLFYQDPAQYPSDTTNADNLRRPVLSSNTSKWRQHLSPGQIRVCEAVAGPRLEAYGYARSLPAAHLTRAECWYRQYIEHPPRRLIARLKDQQGQRERLNQLLLHLRLRLVDRLMLSAKQAEPRLGSDSLRD